MGRKTHTHTHTHTHTCAGTKRKDHRCLARARRIGWHDGKKINIYVGYVPPSESIPFSTWWTALLNRVSLPEPPSTPFCFCFCFCCLLSSIFCSTVCVSGLHPAEFTTCPPLCLVSIMCVCVCVLDPLTSSVSE